MDFNNEFIRTMGMTLVHSIWEGVVIAFIVQFALSLISKGNARSRYIILVSGLVLLLTSFVASFFIIHQHNSGLIITNNASGELLMAAPHENIPTHSESVKNLDWILQFFEPSYPFLAIGWLLGFMFIGIRTLGGVYFTWLIIWRAAQLPEVYLQHIFNRIREKMNIPSMVRLRIATQMISPMVIGFLKPIVVIPVAAVTGLNTSQIEAIFAHELAHIRRYDHIIIIIQAVARQVLFFHPLAWYLSAEIDRERENSCDDLVMKSFSSPINYIKALAMIQEMNLSGPVQANAFNGRSRGLLNRIKRLIKPELKHSPGFRLSVIFLLLMTLGITAVALSASSNKTSVLPMQGLANEPFFITMSLPDTSKIIIVEKTIKAEVKGPKDVVKKNVIIKIENDTVKELTVNGQKIPKSEIKEYEDEINEIQKEMESSEKDIKKADMEKEESRMEKEQARMELEQAQMEYQKARQEMERARHEVDRAREKLRIQELPQVGKPFNPFIFKLHEDSGLYKYFHSDEFKENLSKLKEELNRSREDLQHNLHQLKKEDWEKYREEWEKAGKEMKRAFEEFNKNRKDSIDFFITPHKIPGLPVEPYMMLPIPPVPPPIPDIEVLPHIDDLIIEPDEPLELWQEAPEQKGESDESLKSKLRELEE
jgi:bla regulator protein BlaR1